MSETTSNLTRRKFMIMGSTAIASPLLLDIAGAMAASKTGETKTTGQKAAKPSKVYFINRTCIGCQACRMFCPAKAIRFGDCQNEIVQEKCINCGTCYNECPICAVSETEL